MSEEKATTVVAALALGFCSTAVVFVWRGYVLAVLWRWFITPAFNLPELTIPYAIGFSVTVSYLTYQHQKDDRTFIESILSGLLNPAAALFIGWVVAAFV